MNILAREPLGDIDRQALPSELVHDPLQDRPAIGGAVNHDIRNMPLPSSGVAILTKHKTCPAFTQSITAKNALTCSTARSRFTSSIRSPPNFFFHR
jgi:hypothetical protein